MKRFLFDTSVLIDYIHEENVAHDVLVLAARHGQGYVSVISLMELWLPRHKSGPKPHLTDDEIREEISRLCNACKAFGFKVLTCSRAAVGYALALLEYCHSPLGKNAVTDSLLIASGISLRALLIAWDKKWKKIVEQLQTRRQVKQKVVVMDPVEFVQTYVY